jgi:hypothetical protein
VGAFEISQFKTLHLNTATNLLKEGFLKKFDLAFFQVVVVVGGVWQISCFREISSLRVENVQKLEFSAGDLTTFDQPT